MEVVYLIIGVILLIALLAGASAMGWIFKGIGAIFEVFLEGLSNFFGTGIGCLIKIFILLCILAALLT